MNKKAVSPLIATVLVIGFTIALAAIIMTWGGGFVKKTTEDTSAQADIALKCATQLDFAILSVTGNDVMIENKANLDIMQVIVRGYPATGDPTTVKIPDPVDLANPEIPAYNVKTVIASVPAGATKVSVIASISGGEGKEPVVCSQAVKEYMLTA